MPKRPRQVPPKNENAVAGTPIRHQNPKKQGRKRVQKRKNGRNVVAANAGSDRKHRKPGNRQNPGNNAEEKQRR